MAIKAGRLQGRNGHDVPCIEEEEEEDYFAVIELL
jgi:hypothetical protein